MSMRKRLNPILSCLVLTASVSGLSFTSLANAAGGGNNECPVGVLPGKPGVPETTLDLEFGSDTSNLTTCLNRRHNVKVVMQINKACRDSYVDADGNVKNTVGACRGSLDPDTIDFGRSYALGNINNMINDYEITYGMVAGRDYEIVAVVHSGGGNLLLKDESYNGAGGLVTGRNKFQQEVMNLMDRGVKFYFCQNTTRGFIRNGTLPAGNATAQLIPGVEYVTAGVTAISDFQDQGYRYVQP